MPIKPEKRHLYPPEWPEIRERILERAGHRCEHAGCGARQYAFGTWRPAAGAGWIWHELPESGVLALRWSEARQRAAEAHFARGEDSPRPIVIVLTIAHLDHNPANCCEGNLRALCQRHHLAHDHEHHLANAQATRRAKAGTLELF